MLRLPVEADVVGPGLTASEGRASIRAVSTATTVMISAGGHGCSLAQIADPERGLINPP